MEQYFNILGFTGSAAAITALVLGLFWKGDEAFNPGFLEKISHSLLNLELNSPTKGWNNVFIRIFDRTFGEKHLSWKCFFRSAIASFLFFILIFFIIHSINNPKAGLIDRAAYEFRVNNTLAGTIYILAITMIFTAINVFGDYVSLLETRRVLSYLGRINSNFAYFFVICCDIVFSALIFYAFVLFTFATPNTFFLIIEPDRAASFYKLLTEINTLFRTDLGQAMLATSLLTSIWLWIYLAGLCTLRSLLLFRPVLRFFQRSLNIQSYPIRSIGVVASCVTGTFFGCLALVMAIF